MSGNDFLSDALARWWTVCVCVWECGSVCVCACMRACVCVRYSTVPPRLLCFRSIPGPSLVHSCSVVPSRRAPLIRSPTCTAIGGRETQTSWPGCGLWRSPQELVWYSYMTHACSDSWWLLVFYFGKLVCATLSDVAALYIVCFDCSPRSIFDSKHLWLNVRCNAVCFTSSCTLYLFLMVLLYHLYRVPGHNCSVWFVHVFLYQGNV